MGSTIDINGNAEQRQLNRERIDRVKSTVQEIYEQERQKRREELTPIDRNIEDCEEYHYNTRTFMRTDLPCSRGVKKFSKHTVTEHRQYFVSDEYDEGLDDEYIETVLHTTREKTQEEICKELNCSYIDEQKEKHND